MHLKGTSSIMGLIAVAALVFTACAQTSPRAAANATGAAQTSATTARGVSTAASSVSESGSAAAQAGHAAAGAEQATNVSARLTKSLDSKHAKVGDEVVARTTEKARLADGTQLPKGSRLLGRVTRVRAKSRAEHDGQLAFSFDRAILRNGREIPIHAVMDSISAPAPPAVSGDMMGQGGMSAGPAMSGGGGVRGGGLLGGGGGGAVGGVGAPVGALRGSAGTAGNLAGNTASGLDAAGNGAMRSTSSLGRNTAALGGMAGSDAALSGQPMPVGNLSGVTFTNLDADGAAGSLASSGSAAGSATASRHGIAGSAGAQDATLLTARGRNVDLAGGSQMTMSVTPQSH